MSKKDEALKLALEALESCGEDEWCTEDDFGMGQTYEEEKVTQAITAIREALAEQPAQPKYRRGDRLICLETEEYCVIHISGTDRQWVKFPDAHIGVYKNEQLAELFELLPKEIEIEQPAQQELVEWLTGCPECGMDEGCDCDSGTWNPPAQQEPVEYQYRTRPDWIPEWSGWNSCGKDSADAYEKNPYLHDWHYEVRKLYTSPPAQRAWVGMTHEEHMEIMTGTMTTSSRMAAVEAKLREKNT